MTKEIIKQFEKKQGITFVHSIARDDVHGFNINNKLLWFDGDDITYDIEASIEAGRIILYATEGLNGGKIPDYKTWLTERYGY